MTVSRPCPTSPLQNNHDKLPMNPSSLRSSLFVMALFTAASSFANNAVVRTQADVVAQPGFPALAGHFVQPVPIRQVAPAYPLHLRRNGTSGLVNVTCMINENGRVQNASVESATHGDFKRPAIEAVNKWIFKPALRDGMPVPSTVTIPIQFTFVDE